MSQPVIPWYKQRWPWILMSGPAMVVAAGFITLGLAIHTSDSLVDDDYYKKGKAINEDLARDQQADTAGIGATVMFADGLSAVRVLLNSQDGKPLPETLLLSIQHPTMEGMDQVITLRQEGPGTFTAPLAMKGEARHWYLRIEDPERQWRVEGEWKPLNGPMIRLVPNLPPADS